MRYDAIVIGAGPAGGSAAILLARAGWSVAIVEKAAFPRRKVCGEFISASNALLLRELGIAEAFDELAGPEVRRVGAYAGDALVAADMPSAVDGAGGPGGWGRALGRDKLDTLLLEQAVREGARVWQPWSAIGLEHGDQGYACRIAGEGEERTLIAPILIAAHGSWERGTLPTQAVRPHRRSDLFGFKAHFRNCDLPPGLMPLLAFPGGYGGMVASDGGRVSLSCCIRRDTLQECRRRTGAPHAAAAILQHMSDSCVGVRQALSHAELEDRWLAAGPIHPGIRCRTANGVFLVGNAAGEAHPIVAEGISMAMQSASLLCRHLVARQDDALAGRLLLDIHRAYSADWQALFATRIRAAALFAHLAMRPVAVAALTPVVKAFPKILTLGARLSGKTKLHAGLRGDKGPRSSAIPREDRGKARKRSA